MADRTCPDCGGHLVVFAVPPDLREYAPGGGARAAICARCLRTRPADGGPGEADADADPDPDPEFTAIDDAFPGGTAGVALALACGRLGSLALDRAAIVALCERAEAAGGDVLLTLDRLAAGDVDPAFDLDRRRGQLADLL
jgi:hypothetical protein